MSRLAPAKPTIVYDTLWRFAMERQEVFFRRLEGCSPPWTHDFILAHYKFTNAYRASDRVSQYLIRQCHLRGCAITRRDFLPHAPVQGIQQDLKLGRSSRAAVGEVAYSSYSFDTYDKRADAGTRSRSSNLFRGLHHALSWPCLWIFPTNTAITSS